ncbi:hypothetical protein GCM10018966_025890 [Streptomyces yanii]
MFGVLARRRPAATERAAGAISGGRVKQDNTQFGEQSVSAVYRHAAPDRRERSSGKSLRVPRTTVRSEFHEEDFANGDLRNVITAGALAELSTD